VLPISRFYASLRRARERSDLPESKFKLVHEPTMTALHEMKRARDELERAGSAGTLAPAIRALRRIELRLQRPLRIAVIGEFNSGKSTLTNLLVRIESLPTAVISNTCIPTLIYHAPTPEVFAVYHDRRRQRLRAASRVTRPQDLFRLEVGLPAARLRAVEILDLPGLADARFDGSIADLASHAVDVALWCTLSTQAWKESERSTWEEIPTRLRSRGLLVATHRDLLHDAADVEKLLDRLRDEAGPWFRNVLPMSTVEALTVARDDHAGQASSVWETSGADAFETALDELLQSVRMQRLHAALEVTGRIAGRTLSRIHERPLDGRDEAPSEPSG
jgi:hypothetical protein